MQRSFPLFETGVPCLQRSSFLRTQKLIPVRPVASDIWQVAAAGHAVWAWGQLLWGAYGPSQEAVKAEGRAVLCKEGSCALRVILSWIEACMLWWKDTEKGKGSCILLLMLRTGPQPIFTSGTGLWSMKTKLGIWQSSGYWICFHWNVEWDRTSLPSCSHWPFHDPFSSCHPERISHKWLRDHKVFYTDVILWIQSVSQDWISPLMGLWLYE